jgi:hypothetical protein
MDNIFGSHLYYHVILIDDFSNPGVSAPTSGLYPNGYLGQETELPMADGAVNAKYPSYVFPTK